MTFIFVLALLAQMLDPTAAQQAYTTADPINPDRFGLATIDGRFSVTPARDCVDITIGENILIWPAAQLPPWLALAPMDGTLESACIVQVNGRMDNTPCALNVDRQCDVAVEAGQ